MTEAEGGRTRKPEAMARSSGVREGRRMQAVRVASEGVKGGKLGKQREAAADRDEMQNLRVGVPSKTPRVTKCVSRRYYPRRICAELIGTREDRVSILLIRIFHCRAINSIPSLTSPNFLR